MSLENRDNCPDPNLRRQNLNSFLNHLFELEIGSSDRDRFVYVPAVEIKETNRAFYIRLEIPGITKRQIHLELTSIAVVVRGERTFIRDADNEKTIYSNFRYGRWQRIISLPAPITIHGAIAEYADGVLKLVLYKHYAEL